MFTHRACIPDFPKMKSELVAKKGQMPRLQISKTHDQHTHILQHWIVIKNYKLCAGTVTSTLTLPETFCAPKDKTKTLLVTLNRSKFLNRPMEIVLDGVRSHWSSYKCSIRRSDDNDDDMEFAAVNFVRSADGNGNQVSGLFKEQLRDDLYIRLTICIANVVENVATSSKIYPQLAQISKLFMKETYADFHIHCAYNNEDEHRLPVHRIVLSTSSPYFRAMFQPEMAEAQNGHVTLTIVPYKALHELLYCIYHGERSPQFSDTALDLMLAADFFEIITLRDYAATYLAYHLNKESVFKVLHIALQLCLSKLARQACEFIRENVDDDEAKAKLTELQKQCPELIVHLIELM